MLDEQSQPISAHGVKVAIIVSAYHSSITIELTRGARACFIDAGGKKEDCLLIPASGAWELPVLAKKATVSSSVDLVVALGCIIEGETTHDKIIGHAIADGLMQISVDWGNPVSMGVLTCQNLSQAVARTNVERGNKGEEAMHAGLAALETLRSMGNS